MAAPASLLDLALTLHPALPADRQDRNALVACRLGCAEVWLPVGADAGFPDAARLDALTQACGPTRLGLLATGVEPDLLARLAATGGVLLELAGVVTGPALVHAVGGPRAWRARVRLPVFDPTAAGTVVTAATRSETRTAVAVAAAQRAAAGFTAATHPVFAALPVAIAGRDGRLPGADPDSGLFGTYEQAQAQMLELAAAGADGLRVVVPPDEDVADLLGQLRSVVTGAAPGPQRRA